MATIKGCPPLVGVTACRVTGENTAFMRCGEKYVRCVVEPANCMPVIIPALGDRIDIETMISRLDGLLLTGSSSNVEPHHYEAAPSVEGIEHDPYRDAVTLPLIRAAAARGVPMLGLCRGLQEMNVAFGGTLHQRVFDLPDRFDHRMRRDVDYDLKYRPAHAVQLTKGGMLESLIGAPEILVNSLHAQAIDRPGDDVCVEAVAPDGIVEAISVPSAPGFALAVQWHPEWPVPIEGANKLIFEAFGDACRAYAEARMTNAMAAE